MNSYSAAESGSHRLHKRLYMVFAEIASFVKKNAVMVIAFAAAAVSAVFVPPDAEYLGYFDWKTLCCLFSMLAVVCALRNIKFFTAIAQTIIRKFANLRRCALALVYITFIGSMFMANDMALLTFLPLGYYVLKMTGKTRSMAYVFILQNIAANLGGMLTPFGNPQNLYLYSKFNIPTGEFMGIMLPYFLLSMVMVTVCCFFIKPEPLSVETPDINVPGNRAALLLVLFAAAIIMVFRVIPFYIGTLVIIAVLLFVDRDALKKVDYPLLLTFFAFFIFAGNMARIDAVCALFGAIPDEYTLFYSAASCQVISNVPSALLLSQFTANYADLLVGVNIGGVGTLIASLASLNTFRTYNSCNAGSTMKFVGLFALVNFSFLAIMTGFAVILKMI